MGVSFDPGRSRLQGRVYLRAEIKHFQKALSRLNCPGPGPAKVSPHQHVQCRTASNHECCVLAYAQEQGFNKAWVYAQISKVRLLRCPQHHTTSRMTCPFPFTQQEQAAWCLWRARGLCDRYLNPQLAAWLEISFSTILTKPCCAMGISRRLRKLRTSVQHEMRSRLEQLV